MRATSDIGDDVLAAAKELTGRARTATGRMVPDMPPKALRTRQPHVPAAGRRSAP